MMLGGFFLFSMATLFPGNPILVFLIPVVLGFGVGWFVYWLAIRTLAGQPVFVTIIVTICLGMIIEGIVYLAWGARILYPLGTLGLSNTPHFLPGGLRFSTFEIASITGAFIYIGGLFLFYRFSSIGKQMRAASEDPMLASYRGISISMVLGVSWGIATLGAMLGGVFHATNINLQTGMSFIGLKAFPAAMVGGMDSLIGVIPGAIIMGTVEVLAAIYGSPLIANVAPMGVLLVVLIIWPWGFFGTKEEIERV